MPVKELKIFVMGYQVPTDNCRSLALRAKHKPSGIRNLDGSLSFKPEHMYEVRDYIEITCHCGTMFLYSDGECRYQVIDESGEIFDSWADE